MYEHRLQPPISRPAFIRRLAIHADAALLLIVGSLGLGVSGYVFLEGLPLPDAFLHASTLLGGLGIAGMPTSTGAKLFAGLYALYSGLVFLAAFGIIFAPIVHRILHKFHWNGGNSEKRLISPNTSHTRVSSIT